MNHEFQNNDILLRPSAVRMGFLQPQLAAGARWGRSEAKKGGEKWQAEKRWRGRATAGGKPACLPKWCFNLHSGLSTSFFFSVGFGFFSPPKMLVPGTWRQHWLWREGQQLGKWRRSLVEVFLAAGQLDVQDNPDEPQWWCHRNQTNPHNCVY